MGGTSDAGNNGRGGELRRRGCSCTKDDFLPEESFKSFGNYLKALGDTPARLKDRVLTRSLETTEMNEVKAESGHDMKRTLTWWDLMWFGVGSVIGSGIFILTGLEAKNDAGPAVVVSYTVSGVSALLSVFCYTEFAVEIPVAGGSFSYLRVELGDFMAFIAAGNILLEYVITNAALARSWTSYFATLINKDPTDLLINAPALADGYNQLDPIASCVCAAICIIALSSTKVSSRINYVASVIHIGVILFIIIAGLCKSDPNNYTPFAPYGVRGIFQASAVLFFSYVGFDAVSTMAEETKNPGRDIPIGLVGSMLIVITCYCLMAVTLCLMVPYKMIDENAGFSIAFERVGWTWAKYLVSAGALKGMTTVLLTTIVGQARYLTHIARTHMMPPWFAKVNHKTGTPVNATISMVAVAMVVTFFTDLEILANLLSISTLFIFMLVAVGLLVRRYYVSGETTPAERNKFIVCLATILLSSIAVAVFWAVNTPGWICYAITLGIWFLATLVLAVFIPQSRKPKLWGVPLVPWLPSASIAINIFLLGSIDGASFVRFGVWTGIILVYYVFFGLHASYDNAKTLEQSKNQALHVSKLEEGMR